MKCEAQIFMEMDEVTLRELVREVKETIASDVQPVKSTERTFSVVDMWNIRRTTRSANTMLYRGRL